VTLNLAETSVAKSRPSVRYGANLFLKCHPHLELYDVRLLHFQFWVTTPLQNTHFLHQGL